MILLQVWVVLGIIYVVYLTYIVVSMTLTPQVAISYEAGRYTATITRGTESIVTDGQTLDELLAHIDDAFACHMEATV